jgi:hypothetical protein
MSNLNTVVIPEAWNLENILPIFRNEGERLSTQNYRPITLYLIDSMDMQKKLNYYVKVKQVSELVTQL